MGKLLGRELQTQLLGLFIPLGAHQQGREEFQCSCCCLVLRPHQLLGAVTWRPAPAAQGPQPPLPQSFCLGREILNKAGLL